MSEQTDSAAARANLRETVKWLIAALAAVAAVLLGSGPLTGLGQIENPEILWLALASGGIGLACVMIAIFQSTRMLATRPFFFSDLKTDSEIKAQINTRSADLLPPEYPDYDNFIAERDKIAKKLRELAKDDSKRPGWQTASDRCELYVDRIMNFAYFETERARFSKLGVTLALLSAIAIVCFGTFAWAATTKKDEKSLQVICLTPAPDAAAGRAHTR